MTLERKAGKRGWASREKCGGNNVCRDWGCGLLEARPAEWYLWRWDGPRGACRERQGQHSQGLVGREEEIRMGSHWKVLFRAMTWSNLCSSKLLLAVKWTDDDKKKDQVKSFYSSPGERSLLPWSWRDTDSYNIYSGDERHRFDGKLNVGKKAEGIKSGFLTTIHLSAWLK